MKTLKEPQTVEVIHKYWSCGYCPRQHPTKRLALLCPRRRAHANKKSFTWRNRQIFEACNSGKTLKQVAKEFDLSVSRITQIRNRIYREKQHEYYYGQRPLKDPSLNTRTQNCLIGAGYTSKESVREVYKALVTKPSHEYSAAEFTAIARKLAPGLGISGLLNIRDWLWEESP